MIEVPHTFEDGFLEKKAISTLGVVFPESYLVMAMAGGHPSREQPGSIFHSPAQVYGSVPMPEEK